ncbi:hypothetical protein LA303_13375 [Candidatus Sulfidibacterium hydrothermale]|uniref:putative LPS assembly protein LptD n=1 Tax=Candidatus Sulfidibacterium hydrothermale TaxID=2875962 RepID=UPI001F0AE90D|nr:putative LPS assembly protein LptD [Candidatus Sulfidibacterium hydrothermale]UBM62371.1 hypothetical protein LA303_13375 [Candidatus Sulfidibacterium hydrothermale]
MQKNDSIADSTKAKKPVNLEFDLVRHAQDSIVQDLAHKKVYLYGKAEVTYGDIDLKAGYIRVDFNNNTVFAKGIKDSTGKIVEKPVFKQGSESFTADSMTYNFITKKGIVHDVRTEEDQGFLHGSVVKRMPDNSINVKGGWFTTCNLAHPHYEFRFGKARVIPNKLIVTGPVYMEIEGVPVPLALPFGIFPNNPKRQSGFIVPTYGESATQGFYLQGGGFFWAMSDYVTLKITGDIYTGGSWKISPVFTYRKRYKYNGSLNFSIARNVINTKGDPDYSNTKDFRVGWTYNQDPKAHPNSRFSANVNIITSNYVKYNTVNINTYLSNQFQSSIAYQKSWDGKYFLTLSGSHSQNTKTHLVQVTLPELSFTVNRFYPFRKKNSISKNPFSNLSVSYSMAAKNEVSTTDSMLFTQQTFSHDMQNGIIHKVPISLPMKVLKYFTFTTSANFTDRMYFESLRKYFVNEVSPISGEDTTYLKTDTIPGFNNLFDFSLSASLTTKLYGMLRFKKGFLRAIRHVITPSIGFSYVPDFGSEKWGYTGMYTDTTGQQILYSRYQGFIYGAPGTQKVGNINFSISNSLEIKVRSRKDTITGTKKIPLIQNFTISGNYDFAKDSLRMSNLYLSGRTTLWKGLTMQYSSVLYPYVTDSAGRTINKTEWQVNRRLFRVNNTSWNVSFNFQLSDKDFKKGKKEAEAEKAREKKVLKKAPESEANDILNHPENYIDWGVSWSLNLSYNFTYTNNKVFLNYEWPPNRKIIQTLALRGQVNITPNWKVTVQTGWDFTNNELSFTRMSLYRNLHCWEMRFSWIPTGPRKSWDFSINVKSSILQDLKLTKKKDFRDYY